MSWYRNEETDVWESAQIQVLRDALEEACRHAQANGITVDEFGDNVRDAMATRIIAKAKRGEFDKQRLIESALQRLKQGPSQYA
jgi:hypothetical protein